jgi:hypothetical protein
VGGESSRLARAAAQLALSALLVAVVGADRGSIALAACTYSVLSLGQVAQQAPVAVIGDVQREQPDGAGGFVSTIRVRGVIKGRPPGPYVRLSGLGHLAQDCQGGPRLARGGRYVLFLSVAPGADPTWSLFDQDGGVYQLTAQGTRTPPDRGGDAPQLRAIAPAELVRDAGIMAGADSARIEDLIQTLNLSETVDAPPPSPASHRSWWPPHPPPQALLLAIAAGAVTVAGLTYLLWRPPTKPMRRR